MTPTKAIKFKSAPQPLSEDDKTLPLIYCFIVSVPDVEGGRAMSISEHGHIFISRPTNNHDTAQWDTGYRQTPDSQAPVLSAYAVAYPQGVQLKWVGDPMNHEGVLLAMDRASVIEAFLNQAVKLHFGPFAIVRETTLNRHESGILEYVLLVDQPNGPSDDFTIPFPTHLVS